MTNKSMKISETVAAFKAGEISRDEYWTRMQSFHLDLREYQRLAEEAMLSRIEITRGELLVVLGNGLTFRWLPEDIRTAPNILVNHGGYESDELRVMSHLARHCRVVFDIGANIGWYSMHLARLMHEQGGTVYSFEPVPSTMKELRRNIQLNGYGEVINAYNLALGESEGTIELFIPAFTGSVAASARPLFPGDVNQTAECRVTTLDTFVYEHAVPRIDLVKCDVEGFELSVLKGGLNSIKTFQPIIMLEMLRKWARVYGYHPNDIISLLRTCGYKCWSFSDNEFSEVSYVDESCMQTNFFFLNEEHHQDLCKSISEGEFAASLFLPSVE